MKKLGIVLAGLMMGLGLLAVPNGAWATESQGTDGQGGSSQSGGGGSNTGISGSDICTDTNVSDELKAAAGCDLSSGDTLVPVVTGIIQVVLGLVGIVAVCVMIYGGFTYLTSTGNPAKIAKAKNILLYGVVGVVVAGLAYAIVFFVSKALGG